jgi:hypothetical protein
MTNFFKYFGIACISFLFFVAASYANTFESLLANCLCKFCLGFVWGFILARFSENNIHYFISFSITCTLIIYLLRPFDYDRLIYILPNYSFYLSGYFIGFYWKHIRPFFRYILLFCTGIFCWINVQVIYPNSVMNKINKNSSVLIGKSLDDFFKNAKIYNPENVAINSFVPNKIYLIEFYFEHCLPCKMKEKDLPYLKGRVANNNFEIIYIDNGAADSKEVYDQLYTKNFDHYYDSAGTFGNNLGIPGFPFEIIADRKGIIRYVSNGYGANIREIYVEQTFKKIKTLIDE